MIKSKTKTSYRNEMFLKKTASCAVHSFTQMNNYYDWYFKKRYSLHRNIFLGWFSGPAKKSQRKRPEKRAAGEAAERIPAGPRHRWHQADISTETGGGEKRKTRVCPLLYSSLPLVSRLLSSHLLLSSPLLSFSSPLPPSSFTCMSSTPTSCSTVWVVGFFSSSLPLARPLCA